MNTLKTEKHVYSSPSIERVTLDNEISLVLQSAPPAGPNEISAVVPEYFNPDPFKTNIL